jgi:hypothetical protein
LQTSPTVASAASAARIGGSTLSDPVAALRRSSRRARTAPESAPGAQALQRDALLGLDRGVDPQRLVRLDRRRW